MSLPPPDKNGYGPWNDYRIDTPAFSLEPCEKPDMSPFLVHMTTKMAIHGILNSENEYIGKINSSKPLDAKSWFNEQVVCFTESPIFAIDAFRYIRFSRWKQDLRFGIGFSKSKLVERGVRPVLYCDTALVSKLKRIDDSTFDDLEENSLNIKETIRTIIPLMNSLMENEPKQGFIWEREWRYPNPDGFQFSYSDIEIICCPADERDNIAAILGPHAKNIKFVESWEQYNQITEFLDHRNKGWETSINVKGSKKDELIKLKMNYMQELNKARTYANYIENLKSELSRVNEFSVKLSQNIEEVERELSIQNSTPQMDYCCVCGCDFSDENSAITWNDDGINIDFICSNCHAEYIKKCNNE
jgi:hypothetical protein